MPPMTATEAGEPMPVMRMITGAIATKGTLRSSRAIGMTAVCTPRESRKTTASTRAATMPATKPATVSTSVTPTSPRMSDRCVVASLPETSQAHTSAGPLAT